MTEEKMEIMIAQENQQEVAEIVDFLKTLKLEQKKEFLAFVRGAKFMESLALGNKTKTAQCSIL